MLPDDSDPHEWIFENTTVTFVTWLDESISTHWSTSLLRPPLWVMSRWLSRTSFARTSITLSRLPLHPLWRQQPTTLTSSTLAPGLWSAMLPLSTTGCLLPSASPRGVSVLHALRPLSWPIPCVPGRRHSPRRSPCEPAGLEAMKDASDSEAPWTA